ncbi:trihelix transcription factor ASIL1 isoform X2 [Phalaenopsis equestris]|uniref:trihelix transcription factor ASIL1 isoform X2 n=1 Tax=Phalaenopsis equestris TaxID=78828 RepID=UPI0009E65AC3|nr:trihelix transcription factor ASIL1 isoform X2 [Phalaenopsis equestris]
MDDMEDDARYPPNPYPQINRRPFPSSNYSSLHARNNSYPSQIPRSFPDDYVDEDEEEERNDVDLAVNDAEEEEEEELEDEEDEVSAGRGYLRTRNEANNEEDDVDESSESLGKRRRLDRYARGFELVPRSVASPASKPLQCRNSSADWSEDSTFALLDAWGDRYLQNGRKSLRSDEWGEVAKKVSQGSKTPRSEAQCRNRLDTLKKKYKKEKAKHPDYSGLSSKWVYFQKMDELMLSPPPQPPAARQHSQSPRLSCGIDAGEYVFANSKPYLNHSDGLDEVRDSPSDTASEGEGEDVDDESDGLPPRREKVGDCSESSFKMLADSIQKFGAIYEKIESSKRQQIAELEKMRKEFHRDLELQKRQILDRAQAEISRLRQEDGEGEDDEDGDGDDDDIDVSAENMSGL